MVDDRNDTHSDPQSLPKGAPELVAPATLLGALPTALRERALKLYDTEPFAYTREHYQKNPENHGWTHTAGDAFLRLGEYRIAEHVYSEALKRPPMVIMSHAGLGVCAYYLDKIGEALRHMQSAISLLVRFELSQVEHLNLNLPGDPIWHTSIPVKGLMLHKDVLFIGNAGGSMFELASDKNLPTTDEEFANFVMPDAFFHFGNFARKRGHYEIAEVCFRLVVRVRPDHTLAQTNLGTALAEHGRVREALVELQKAIVLNPADAIAHAGIGVVFKALGNRSKALEHLSRALEVRGGAYPYATEQLEQLKTGRDRDPTGLCLARRLLMNDLASAVLSANKDAVLSVVFLDMNGLKAINDNHGHHTGDEAIRTYLEAVVATFGKHGEAYRGEGGDEVVVILPGVGDERAGKLLDTFTRQLGKDILVLGDAKAMVRLTASCGSVSTTDSNEDAVALYKRADDAQYRAKAEARTHTPRVSTIAVGAGDVTTYAPEA